MALWLSSSFSFTVTTGIFEQLGPVFLVHLSLWPRIRVRVSGKGFTDHSAEGV